MMWGYYDSWNWLWMAGTMLLFLLALITFLVWLVRSSARPGGDAALDTLRKRFAAGDLSQEEFEKARRTLLS